MYVHKCVNKLIYVINVFPDPTNPVIDTKISIQKNEPTNYPKKCLSVILVERLAILVAMLDVSKYEHAFMSW
jgi:hypothetical protein